MAGRSRTIEQLVTHARTLKERFGLLSHKLKGGVFAPEYELSVTGFGRELDGDRFRFDQIASGPPKPRSGSGSRLNIRNDYLEDPVYGMNGMRRVREKVRMPLATNTVIVNFEQLAANASILPSM
jgi:glucarate dehydratase